MTRHSQVGPSIWLGRVWLTDSIQRLNPSSLTPDLAPVFNYLIEAETATLGWAATVTGLKDQYYQDKQRNSGYFTPQVRPEKCIHRVNKNVLVRRCNSKGYSGGLVTHHLQAVSSM